MPSPLRATHVVFTAEQLDFLRLTAARKHVSVSIVLRDLVDQARARQQAADRRRRRQEDQADGGPR